MMMLILSMLLIGVALGRRFKVFVLVPAVGFAFIISLTGGIAHGDGAPSILIAAVLASSSLQIAYFCGILTRHYNVMATSASSHKAVHRT
jgi:hypothetical protein